MLAFKKKLDEVGDKFLSSLDTWGKEIADIRKTMLFNQESRVSESSSDSSDSDDSENEDSNQSRTEEKKIDPPPSVLTEIAPVALAEPSLPPLKPKTIKDAGLPESIITHASPRKNSSAFFAAPPPLPIPPAPSTEPKLKIDEEEDEGFLIIPSLSLGANT